MNRRFNDERAWKNFISIYLDVCLNITRTITKKAHGKYNNILYIKILLYLKYNFVKTLHINK